LGGQTEFPIALNLDRPSAKEKAIFQVMTSFLMMSSAHEKTFIKTISYPAIIKEDLYKVSTAQSRRMYLFCYV
jgi:hypothetical protein